jgi:hypothetical protein
MELGCYCHPLRNELNGGVCIRTADELLAQLCAEGKEVIRRRGCGRQTFSPAFSTGGATAVYDVESGRVVGLHDGNDTRFGQCDVFVYFFGRALTDHPATPAADRCETIQTCTVCGPSNYYPKCP